VEHFFRLRTPAVMSPYIQNGTADKGIPTLVSKYRLLTGFLYYGKRERESAREK
jgi:hypothetical protein